MALFEVHRVADGATLLRRVKMADGLYARTLGLMFRPEMGDIDGLVIKGNGIHTHFMRFPMDAVFLDRENRVVKYVRAMRPWRMTWFYPRAVRVLEAAGNAMPADLAIGERLEVRRV